jgi:hypothetical protein
MLMGSSHSTGMYHRARNAASRQGAHRAEQARGERMGRRGTGWEWRQVRGGVEASEWTRRGSTLWPCAALQPLSSQAAGHRHPHDTHSQSRLSRLSASNAHCSAWLAACRQGALQALGRSAGGPTGVTTTALSPQRAAERPASTELVPGPATRRA